LPERLDPSAYSERTTLFFTSEEASPVDCLPPGKSHPQGLATLSMVSSPFHPWKPLSASNALGLRLSELFSSLVIKKGFPRFFPLWRFPIKPSQPDTGAPAVLAHQRSRPPLAPEWLVRVGGLCSPRVFDLLGAPSTWHGFEVSIFESPLSSLSWLRSCEHKHAGP
jgi:hypothetical protein